MILHAKWLLLMTPQIVNNNWKMRNSNHHIHKEYYNDLSRSRYSSQTSRKLKSVASREDFNDTKTRFLTRIDKACTTMSNNDLSKELGLYRKEIERLQKENLKKDKIIFEIKSTTALNKELETELIETYRIIYMYEGKINQYEKELKRLEVALSKTATGELSKKIEELLESYRLENGELMGRVEESNRIIFELEQKLKKLENKYFSTAWKLSSTKREITNPLKKKFPNLRNTITIKQTPLLEKQKAMKQSAKNQNQLRNDEYQIVETKSKPIIVQKEPIRFKRFENKSDQKNLSQQSSQRQLIVNSGGQFLGVSMNDESTKIHDQSGRRESSITERKVYISPITRFQLNRKVEEVSNLMEIGANRQRFSMLNSQNSHSPNIYY